MINIAEILRKPYHRMIVSEDDGVNCAILEFPGCFACGDTVEEALKNLEEAAKSWLEVSIEAGHKIPEPLNLVHTQKTLGLMNTEIE